MILFEIDSQGYVRSTPSLIPQGMALSDIVIITESDYELVTLRLIPPSGRYIPDVVCTPVKTQDKSANLWQAILPAEAAAMHGVLTYQIFRRNVQGRVTPTQEGALTVQRGVISDMPENVEHLETYSIESLYNLLSQINAKAEDHDRGIDKNASDIDVLEAARPMTGSFSVGDDLWTESDDGYTATIELTENPLLSGDLMLILPDGEDTRKASADVVVSVKSAENGDEADAIVLTAKSKPAVTTLWYRYAVIKRGAEDTTMLPVASIVGVHDVPTYVTDWIDRVDRAAASNEQKIDNFLYGVTDEARDQLSEVLGLISANADAIETFKNMGGAPVGSGTLVVPASEWSDGSPTTAYVDVPGNAMHAGSVMLLTPANDATKAAAEAARLSVLVDVSGDYPDAASDTVVLLRAETAAKPAIDMEFAYVILQTTATTSLVTLIGVDATGGSEPTLVDLSRFEGEPDTESGLIKGYITEVFGEGDDAPKKVTEVVYDEDGNIIKIGNTAINWGEEA